MASGVGTLRESDVTAFTSSPEGRALFGSNTDQFNVNVGTGGNSGFLSGLSGTTSRLFDVLEGGASNILAGFTEGFAPATRNIGRRLSERLFDDQTFDQNRQPTLNLTPEAIRAAFPELTTFQARVDEPARGRPLPSAMNVTAQTRDLVTIAAIGALGLGALILLKG